MRVCAWRGRLDVSISLRYDDEHNVSGQVKQTAVAAVQKAREVNNEYDVTGTLQRGAVAGVAKARRKRPPPPPFFCPPPPH